MGETLPLASVFQEGYPVRFLESRHIFVFWLAVEKQPRSRIETDLCQRAAGKMLMNSKSFQHA